MKHVFPRLTNPEPMGVIFFQSKATSSGGNNTTLGLGRSSEAMFGLETPFTWRVIFFEIPFSLDPCVSSMDEGLKKWYLALRTRGSVSLTLSAFSNATSLSHREEGPT